MKFSTFSLKERPYGDFHTHSNAGSDDGKLSPRELLVLSEEQKLAFLSITGHNTVDGIREIQKPENRILFGAGILPGTEIGVLADSVPIEVLAYAFDISKMERELAMLPINAEPDAYGRYVTDKVNELMEHKGVRIDHDCGCDCRRWLDGLHAKIIEMYPGYLAGFNPRFEENYKIWLREGILNPHSPFAIDLTGVYPDITQMSDMIQDCGGVAVLAHPYEYYDRAPAVLDYVLGGKLVNGVECFHPTATLGQQHELMSYCENDRLVVTGGSDFHTLGNDRYINSQKVPAGFIKQFNYDRLI